MTFPGFRGISQYTIEEYISEQNKVITEDDNSYDEFDNSPNLMGTNATTMSDNDMADYMHRAISRPADRDISGGLQKEYRKLLSTKKPTQEDLTRISEIEGILRQHNRDNYNLPYLHGSNIKDENEKAISPDKLKEFIKVRPTKLLSANGKIQKTGGKFEDVYNLSLPALRGIVVDEKTNELKVIDTCPGAGACKTL